MYTTTLLLILLFQPSSCLVAFVQPSKKYRRVTVTLSALHDIRRNALPNSKREEFKPTKRGGDLHYENRLPQRQRVRNTPRYYQQGSNRRRIHRKYKRKNLSAEEVAQRLYHAKKVEMNTERALEQLRLLLADSTSTQINEAGHTKRIVRFPSVRECNEALAIMGDNGQFLRSLRLFGQMRKAASLVYCYNRKDDEDNRNRHIIHPPSPTLVTYSTLMSRAVSLGKERVALRLWRLMLQQREFYTNVHYHNQSQHPKAGISVSSTYFGSPIVPDIRAVNILMNSFAKIGDYTGAMLLMEHIWDSAADGQSFLASGDPSFESNVTESSSIVPDVLDLILPIPSMEPNIVTFNTLIDACHRAGQLDAALRALDHMKHHTDIQPDARTYTNIISTVARRATAHSGARDPDLAFEFFDEMVNAGINPNGMTYSALIDVCGRCGRSDLALKALRMMLRQKYTKSTQLNSNKVTYRDKSRWEHDRKVLFNEVGAWTAAIKACGRAGRFKTAIDLFHRMKKFGVKPNEVTCGCLADVLLKSGNSKYWSETLHVLRYMKEEGIEPSEVMYTSLITSAARLAKYENEERGELILLDIGDAPNDEIFDADSSDGIISDHPTKALEVYTELMLSLLSPADTAGNKITTMRKGGAIRRHENARHHQNAQQSNALLVKVFLVFQEMKVAGIQPDVTCYNALLRACANAGDIQRLEQVMHRISNDGLDPNHISWKEMLRGAVKAQRPDFAESVWQMALTYRSKTKDKRFSQNVSWMPSVESYAALLSAYMKRAESIKLSYDEKEALYEKVIDSYDTIVHGYAKDRAVCEGLHHIHIDDIHENKKVMSMILTASYHLRNSFYHKDIKHERQQDLQHIINGIKTLECFQATNTN